MELRPGDRVRVSSPKSELYAKTGTVGATYGRRAFVILDVDLLGPAAEFGFSELELFETANEGGSSFSNEKHLTECKS